ncbi:hypothetical protein C8J57DRAFT_1624296 [Mycena rebaudengoi]|nr:hypothetical protein C8J57DRAFT_1624296 [Mycena rebaudengoi]
MSSGCALLVRLDPLAVCALHARLLVVLDVVDTQRLLRTRGACPSRTRRAPHNEIELGLVLSISLTTLCNVNPRRTSETVGQLTSWWRRDKSSHSLKFSAWVMASFTLPPPTQRQPRRWLGPSRFADRNNSLVDNRPSAPGLHQGGQNARDGGQAFGSGTASAFTYFHVEDKSSLATTKLPRPAEADLLVGAQATTIAEAGPSAGDVVVPRIWQLLTERVQAVLRPGYVVFQRAYQHERLDTVLE